PAEGGSQPGAGQERELLGTAQGLSRQGQLRVRHQQEQRDPGNRGPGGRRDLPAAPIGPHRPPTSLRTENSVESWSFARAHRLSTRAVWGPARDGSVDTAGNCVFDRPLRAGEARFPSTEPEGATAAKPRLPLEPERVPT